MNNCYIGRWFEPHKVSYWERIVLESTGTPIRWFDYHTFIVDGSAIDISKKIELYSLLRKDVRYKVIIRNVLLERSSLLLSVDEEILIPLDNWFSTDYERVRCICERIIREHSEGVIIFGMGGMGIKCLFSSLVCDSSVSLTLIDIGSGLDLISTKRDSRGSTSYEVMVSRFSSILREIPEWDSELHERKYGHIYSESLHCLGKHLG